MDSDLTVGDLIQSPTWQKESTGEIQCLHLAGLRLPEETPLKYLENQVDKVDGFVYLDVLKETQGSTPSRLAVAAGHRKRNVPCPRSSCNLEVCILSI